MQWANIKLKEKKTLWTYLTPLGVMLLTGPLSRDRTELWLLLTLGVVNSFRIYWAWWKAIRHTPNKEKLKHKNNRCYRVMCYNYIIHLNKNPKHREKTTKNIVQLMYIPIKSLKVQLWSWKVLHGTDHVKMRVTTQNVSSQLGPGTTCAQRGNMWWGSVTLRVKGKDVPRDVARVRSRITHDDVKSGVNLETHKKTTALEMRRGQKQTD